MLYCVLLKDVGIYCTQLTQGPKAGWWYMHVCSVYIAFVAFTEVHMHIVDQANNDIIWQLLQTCTILDFFICWVCSAATSTSVSCTVCLYPAHQLWCEPAFPPRCTVKGWINTSIQSSDIHKPCTHGQEKMCRQCRDECFIWALLAFSELWIQRKIFLNLTTQSLTDKRQLCWMAGVQRVPCSCPDSGLLFGWSKTWADSGLVFCDSDS